MPGSRMIFNQYVVGFVNVRMGEFTPCGVLITIYVFDGIPASCGISWLQE